MQSARLDELCECREYHIPRPDTIEVAHLWLVGYTFACRDRRHPPLSLLVLALFGIDEIGVELEEPFSILPLELLCDAIETQTRELLAVDGGVQALVARVAEPAAD